MKAGDVIAEIVMEAVAVPEPGMTIEDLIKKVKEAGNEVLEVREDGILIGFKKEHFDGGKDN